MKSTYSDALRALKSYSSGTKKNEVSEKDFILGAVHLVCEWDGRRIGALPHHIQAGGKPLSICVLELTDEKRKDQRFLAVWNPATRRGEITDRQQTPMVLRHYLDEAETLVQGVAEQGNVVVLAEHRPPSTPGDWRAPQPKLAIPDDGTLVTIPRLGRAFNKLTLTLADDGYHMLVLNAERECVARSGRKQVIFTGADVDRLIAGDTLPGDVIHELSVQLKEPWLKDQDMLSLPEAAEKLDQIRIRSA